MDLSIKQVVYLYVGTKEIKLPSSPSTISFVYFSYGGSISRHDGEMSKHYKSIVPDISNIFMMIKS